jgi:hypothetical protein
MYIYEQVNFCDFCDRFRSMDRDANFSYEGKSILFDYLESMAEETGTPIELDVVALCCEFTEYESIEDYNEAYDTEYEDCGEVEECIGYEGDTFVTYAH